MSDDPQDTTPPGNPDRRRFLQGAATGAAGMAALGFGAVKIEQKRRSLTTPETLPEGAAPQIAQSFQDSRPASYRHVQAPAGAPNIVVFVLDDVGFADLGCYGSEIRTPAMDSLASSGLRYTNFRTCSMCSPTRAALLTGLNHHAAGLGWIADIDAGYPGYRGELTHEAVTLAEVLRDAGWSTFLTGKWHLNNAHTTGPSGPYDNWPTQRGFERAYWFQGHSTDYFHPSELFDGVAPVPPPSTEDYYACDDFTDRAITYIRTQQAASPTKPFFLQVAYPGAHSPLQVRGRERDAYLGQYDAGWDVIRAKRLAKQREMGIVPETTVLPPLSRGAQPWNELSSAQQKLFSRYMEVYAGLISNLDTNIGRLLATLDELNLTDNTIVLLMSDNGGSPEGTPDGTPNMFATAFGRPVPLEQASQLYSQMGEDSTFPHYPMGWSSASNTPYRMYKRFAHLGGVADPLIMRWPKGIHAAGELRSQFVHVVDLFPTLLEATGTKRPSHYHGMALKPIAGQSILPTFASKAAATRNEQYFELEGNRAYMEGNWRLVTLHERGTSFDNDHWELYDLANDPNELINLAEQHPEIVERLKNKWLVAAQANNVFPLDDRALIVRLAQDRQQRGIRSHWEFRPPVERLAHDTSPILCSLNHQIEIELTRAQGVGDGVLLAQGSKHAGYVLYIQNGKLVYELSLVPWLERLTSNSELPEGRCTIKYVQTMTARPFEGGGALFINGEKVAEGAFQRTLLATSYDGISVGADLGNQVSTQYQGENRFQGTIQVVRIDIDAQPFDVIETARFFRAMKL